MYAGEPMAMDLRTDPEQINLDLIDFEVYAYMCGVPDNRYRLTKSEDYSRESAGMYRGGFTAAQTAAWKPGMYAIEFHNITTGDITVRKRAFSVEKSASSMDMTNASRQ